MIDQNKLERGLGGQNVEGMEPGSSDTPPEWTPDADPPPNIDPPPTELTTDSEAIDAGLNDSDLGDPSGAGTTSRNFRDGERRWEKAVERAVQDESGQGARSEENPS